MATTPNNPFLQAVSEALAVLIFMVCHFNREYPHANLDLTDFDLVRGRLVFNKQGMLKIKCAMMRPTIGPFSAN